MESQTEDSPFFAPPGLFHRAVLLSGSAHASWAVVDDPVHYAVKLASHVNCSITRWVARTNPAVQRGNGSAVQARKSRIQIQVDTAGHGKAFADIKV